MTFSTFDDIKNLDNENLISNIDSAKKDLFDLRLKKATRQSFKAHLFKHTKRKIAQLLTLQSERLKTKK
jgi:large subunit ribosomal protein L29